jgi:molybdopterin/thiamine biosynthesis adenylyltransferase
MAKFEEVYESTQEMFDEVMRASELDLVITAKVLRVEKQKEVIVPKKATPIVTYLNNIDVFFFVQDEVFDRLEDVSKRYLVEEAIARLAFDPEKNKLSILKGDVETFNLLLRKYSLDIYESMKANISQVVQEIKEDKGE